MHGGMHGWRDGGMEGWRDGEMEGWRDGGMERWRDGGMEGWTEGKNKFWRFSGVSLKLRETVDVKHPTMSPTLVLSFFSTRNFMIPDTGLQASIDPRNTLRPLTVTSQTTFTCHEPNALSLPPPLNRLWFRLLGGAEGAQILNSQPESPTLLATLIGTNIATLNPKP